MENESVYCIICCFILVIDFLVCLVLVKLLVCYCFWWFLFRFYICWLMVLKVVFLLGWVVIFKLIMKEILLWWIFLGDGLLFVVLKYCWWLYGLLKIMCWLEYICKYY